MPVIRSVKTNEVDALVTIARDTFYNSFVHLNTASNMNFYLEQAFDREALLGEMNDEESAFYFLIEEAQVIGYLKLNWGSAQTERLLDNALEIQRIYLVKESQGKGLGAHLVDFAKEIARQKEIAMLWLGVWDQNQSSIRFYEKMGFEVFDKHVFPFGDEDQIDLLMKMRL